MSSSEEGEKRKGAHGADRGRESTGERQEGRMGGRGEEEVSTIHILTDIDLHMDKDYQILTQLSVSKRGMSTTIALVFWNIVGWAWPYQNIES